MRAIQGRVAMAVAVFVVAAAGVTWWAGRDVRAAEGGAGGGGAALGVPAGTKVTVYFRGDAAGQAVQSYVGSVTNNASLTGTLTSAGERWIVVQKDKQEHHVAMSGVLMVVRSKE